MSPPRREPVTCGHCGQLQKCSRTVLEQPVCQVCQLRFARDPKPCPGCGATKVLAFYDAQRRPVMNDITLRNRQLGPEAALQVVEERAPQGFEEVTDVISIGELEQIASSYSRAAGLDVETVNSTQF